MASKRSVGFAVVMSLVLCGGVIWLVVSVRIEENDKTAQAETYEYNGWTYYVYDDPIPLRIEDLINPICLWSACLQYPQWNWLPISPGIEKQKSS